MKYSALIGKPTSHSVSHILYEELANAAGLNEAYKHLKIDVNAEDLPLALKSFSALKFSGINVTLPHKMEVMKHIDEVDETANAIGAVNTIRFGSKTIGYNTDWIGIVTPIQTEITNQEIKTVVIFGTGGAARAAIYAAKQLGALHITVLYRTSHTQDLGDFTDKAKELGIELKDYSYVRDAVRASDVIINATSAGMVGKDKSPFDVRSLDGIDVSDKLYFDVVFNPLETHLLKYFNDRGAKTIDGLWMMIYQAIAALSLWLSRDIKIADQDIKRIHNLLRESISHA